MSESFLQMVATFLHPLLGGEESFVHVQPLGWKFALFDHIALQIPHADNVQPL